MAWQRISRYGDTGEPDGDRAAAGGRPARAIAAAARQADAHGDEAAAVRVLVNGLARHADAPPAERLPALVHLAELRVRTDEPDLAAALLDEVGTLDLSAADRDVLATDLETAAELAADLRSRPPAGAR